MYISRAKACLPYILKTGVATVFIGQHGIGKSQVVKQYCKDNDLQFIDLRLGTMSDAGDLLGLADFELDEHGNKKSTQFFKPRFLPTEGRGILFLDELNRAPNDLIQPIFQLVLDGEISANGYKLPEGWKVVSAMNPPTDDYTVTNFKDLAFNDRFCFIKVEPDFKGFMDYARSNEFDQSILSFLSEDESHLNEKVQDFDINEFAKKSSRSWEFVNKLVKTSPPKDILLDLMVGIVGTESAYAYRSFLEKEDKPIKAEDIFKDIEKVLERKDLDRSDKLTVTFESLYRHLTDNETSDKEFNNLKSFVLSIGRDDAVKFLIDLSKTASDFKKGNQKHVLSLFTDEEVFEKFGNAFSDKD